MRNMRIPTLEYIIKLSNFDEDVDSNLSTKDNTQASEQIHDYYQEMDSGPDPIDYTIEYNNSKNKIKTTFGVFNKEMPNIDNIRKIYSKFSEYELDTIQNFGIDIDEDWNGSIVDIFYDDGILKVGETDYFSVSPYMRILTLEMLRKAQGKDDTTPIRDEMLSTESAFKNPKRPVGGTSGGVIIANTGSGWNLLIGKRSEDNFINSGLYSIFPNGGITYEDVDDNIFQRTVKREFVEEIYSKKTQGSVFYDKNVETEMVTQGWDLRHGDFVTSFVLIIDSPVSYDVLKNSADHNSEMEKIVEIPLDDLSMIKDAVNIHSMSSTPISTILEGIKYFDESQKYPDLSYNVSRKI